MTRRLLMIIVPLCLAGAYVLWDALVVTDEERIEEFVDAITGKLTPERLEAALGYVSPEEVPLEVSVGRLGKTFDTKDVARTYARDGVRQWMGETFRVLRQSIEVRDDDARVALTLLSGAGKLDLEIDLRKRGDEFFVSRVEIPLSP